MRQKKSASILKKFLLFNLGVFSILGLLTIVYLKAIQPNLVKKRTANHYLIIDNTVDHLQRLDINFSGKDIRTFLLSTRFLFQAWIEYNFTASRNAIGDTNILDLIKSFYKIRYYYRRDNRWKIKEKIKKVIEQNKNLIKEAIK